MQVKDINQWVQQILEVFAAGITTVTAELSAAFAARHIQFVSIVRSGEMRGI